MSSDRLQAMEVFIRVVDACSFSAAAAQLGMGQPAVSKTVAQLEERLGVRLLARTTRSMVVTEAGRAFYDSAKLAIEGANRAERVARGHSAVSGRLRVSASTCFSRLHVMPRLPEFLAQHPGVNLEVVVADRFVDLEAEGVDIALRTGAAVDAPGLNVRTIGQAARRVMASTAYWRARGKPKTPEDLASHEAIVLRQGGRPLDEWTFHQGESERAVKLGGRLSVSATEGLREAVLASLGVVIASEWLFSPELASGEAGSALDDWTLPPQPLRVVLPPGPMNPVAREFIGFVERCMVAPYGLAEDAVRSADRR